MNSEYFCGMDRSLEQLVEATREQTKAINGVRQVLLDIHNTPGGLPEEDIYFPLQSALWDIAKAMKESNKK